LTFVLEILDFMRMRISIITPSYNQVQFIERTILSVLDQNYPNIEYIVMDGGSTDGTVEILKKYSDRIIWKSEKDEGQSDAINKGLKMATGDIVAYLNSDDTYEPGAFAKVADFFEKNPEKKWAYGKCKIINENDQEIRKPITFYKNLLLKKFSYSKLLSENFISQPATFWKREIHTQEGFFDESEHFCMDYEFWLRIGKNSPAGVINAYLANFRYYTNSKSGSVNKKQFQDELRIAKKYSRNNFLSIGLHYFNYFKIVSIYRLLNFFK
jgi:glycosyltransferase involved in cell wall biosynthesis